MEAYEAAITRHYRANWDGEMHVRHWERGPFEDLPRSFSVLELAPSEKRKMWTYATCCMSAPTDKRRIELHLFAPKDSLELVELLTIVAHYHRTGHALDLEHTVNFGRGWMGGSTCDHGVVSLPYLDGPALENGEAGGEVKFYWLLPITSAEVDFKKRHGMDALEARFESSGFNYLDTTRRSVV